MLTFYMISTSMWWSIDLSGSQFARLSKQNDKSQCTHSLVRPHFRLFNYFVYPPLFLMTAVLHRWFFSASLCWRSFVILCLLDSRQDIIGSGHGFHFFSSVILQNVWDHCRFGEYPTSTLDLHNSARAQSTLHTAFYLFVCLFYS